MKATKLSTKYPYQIRGRRLCYNETIKKRSILMSDVEITPEHQEELEAMGSGKENE